MHNAEYVLTPAEQKAIEWYAAMRWLDRQGAPNGDSLVERLIAWRDAQNDGYGVGDA